MIRLAVAIALGRLAGWLSRLLGRGGSAVPGLVAERVAPRTIERLAAFLPDGVVVVTGTNGKTTTTKMIVACLEADGRRVVTNRSGSNLERGIATALVQRASWRGAVDGEIAVFEADEAAARHIGRRLSPRLVVATNLARDQLDRYGELDTTATHIAAALHHAGAVVLNADDPRVAVLAPEADAWYYGAVPAVRRRMPSDQELHGAAADVPRPSAPFVEVRHAHPDGSGQSVTLTLPDGNVTTLRLQVPGTYNAYNAAAALAAALRLGVAPDIAGEALEAMPAPFGRGQVIEFRGRRAIVLLVKNPAGLNQAIRILAESRPAPVLVAINDEIADGRDVSWLWDANVEELAETGHRFGAGGTRAADMSLRLKYAGADAWVEPDFARALDRLVADSTEGDTVYVVPTYTAMLTILGLLLPGVPRHEVWT